jgi:hypothetical protein
MGSRLLRLGGSRQVRLSRCISHVVPTAFQMEKASEGEHRVEEMGVEVRERPFSRHTRILGQG